MLEMLLRKDKGSGLVAGNLQMGYYGLIPSAEFITGSALASAVGFSGGVAQNDSEGWLKFSYNSKTIYIAKKSFRNNVSWNMLYNAGLVYGDDSNGLFPTTTPKLQNAKVTIAGMTYRVRLIKAVAGDPAMSLSAGRELTDLFIKVLAKVNSTIGGQNTGLFSMVFRLMNLALEPNLVSLRGVLRQIMQIKPLVVYSTKVTLKQF